MFLFTLSCARGGIFLASPLFAQEFKNSVVKKTSKIILDVMFLTILM